MSRVILGCGYIGKALLEYWTGDDVPLIATTTREERKEELEAFADEVVVLRGNDLAGLRKLLLGATQLVVCVAPGRNGSYQETYLETAKVVCAALHENNSVEHVVYTSSVSVYGNHEGEWVSEESPLLSVGKNAEILCETESLYLKSLPRSVISTVLRLGGIHGPGREHEKRACQIAGTICAGSGDHFTNWVHQKDIVLAIDWVLSHRLEGVYNVCGDDHPTRQDFYQAILKKLNLPSIQWDTSREAPHSGNKRVSSEKLKSSGFVFLR